VDFGIEGWRDCNEKVAHPIKKLAKKVLTEERTNWVKRAKDIHSPTGCQLKGSHEGGGEIEKGDKN